MNAIKVVAIVLVAAGFLALGYGGFSYTKDTTVAKLGPIQVTASQKHTVNVPIWAGIGAIVVGGLVFAAGGRKN